MRRILAATFSLLILTAAGAPTTAAQERAGEVTALLPVARLERSGAAPVALRMRDPVFWQDWVETEAAARARLQLLDGSILNVGSGARFQVVRHDQATGQTELELKFGKVRAEVKKLGAGGRFEVRTETAVVGVIGTHVYIASIGALTTVINFEGLVGVSRAEAAAAPEKLEPFELAEVEPGQPIRKRMATLEELLRALEDTLPGPVIRTQPQQARAGSCLSALASGGLATSGPITSTPFLEVTPRACATAELTPVRLCVPETAAPGAYEYAAPGADGVTRWGAFLVQPPAPLQDAWLLYSPELPPGATHYGRLVGRDNRPLAGVPIRVRTEGKEEVVYTDENGGFMLKAPEKGKIELEVARGEGGAAGPLGEPLKPIKVAINVVDTAAPGAEPPEFNQRGTLVTVPGDVAGARLGTQDLPVLRTVTRAGKTVSSVPIPRDAPEGEAPLELEDPSGQRRTRPLTVYELLAARLDQRMLASGAETQGEFLVCVGSTAAKRLKIRARIVAIGPVHFRGAGAQGKSYERAFEVEPNGLLRVPFAIQAEKGAAGAGIPFTLTLSLEGG